MKTIYNTYVVMESQEQCDRMKELCIDNGLSIGKYESSFEFIKKLRYIYFHYSENSKGFYIGDNVYLFTQITEHEFIELLKTK